MSNVTRIVCLGGGYAAIWLARSLKRAIQRGEVELTIVSRDNFQAFHGLVGEMLGGKVQPTGIANPARRVFYPARFFNAEVESIDLEARKIIAGRTLDGRQYTLEWDHLVLAIGSVDDLSRYPGIGEHALKLKNYWDCFQVRNHILSMLDMAEIEPDPEERRRLLTFVIAGGNYAGIEVACELDEMFEYLVRKDYSRLKLEEIRTVVIHGGDTILPELAAHHPRLVEYARKYLSQLRIDIRLNTRVTAATPSEVFLSSGEALAARTLISCTGIAMSPLLDSLPYSRDARGRVETNEFFQVKGVTNVWAAGDCAAVPNPKGGICPPLGLYAIAAGTEMGNNILCSIRGEPLKPFGFGGLGDACSLARRHAVARLGNVEMTGLFAWLVWRAILWSVIPSWERKARVLADWLLWPIIGREIVNIKMDDRLGLAPVLFEAGQMILHKGDIGRELYIIQDGEVEVFDPREEGEVTLGVLGPGEHFGEIAVFQKSRRTASVRAHTRVHLLAVRRQTAAVLTETLPSLGTLLKQKPHTSPAPEGQDASDSGGE